MKKKTYEDLQRELLSKTKSVENLQKRSRTLRDELLEYKAIQRGLVVQYERIVQEWKRMYADLLNNGWKIVFVKIKMWYEHKKEGR